jgi:hypothetical protein
MVDQWYYAHDADKIGPCSARQLKELAAAGNILGTDTIWREGALKGMPANRVKNLFPVAPAAGLAGNPLPPATAPLPTPGDPGAVHPPAELGAAVLAAPPFPAVGEAVDGADPESAEEWPAARNPAGSPPKAQKKGRAVAIRGAVIIGQDGVYVQYKKKCTTCGFEDACRHTMPIRTGSSRVNFYCPKCRKIRAVEIQGFAK